MDVDDQKVGGLLVDYLHISNHQLMVLPSPLKQSLALEVFDHKYSLHQSPNQSRLAKTTGNHSQTYTMVLASAVIAAANDRPKA